MVGGGKGETEGEVAEKRRCVWILLGDGSYADDAATGGRQDPPFPCP